MRIGPLISNSELLDIQTRVVRDLAWCVTIGSIVHPVAPTAIAPSQISAQLANLSAPASSIPIWSSPRRWWSCDVVSRSLPWFRDHLSFLDRRPEELIRWMRGTESLRHGLRYERFLTYFFHRHPDIEVLAADLPVRRSNRTIGQFDFVLNVGGQTIHVEVAIKYYLRLDQSWRTDRCLGTDLTDRLDIKLAHSLGRQLHLGSHKAAVGALSAYGIDRLDGAQLDLKGILFDRIEELDCNSDGIPNYWFCTRDKLEALRWARDLDWALVTGDRWFSPVLCSEVECEKLPAVLDLTDSKRPTIVAGLDGSGELTRGVILHRPY